MVVLIEGQRVYAWVHAQRLGDRDSLACALCQPAAHHPADYVVLLLPVCLDVLFDDLLLKLVIVEVVHTLDVYLEPFLLFPGILVIGHLEALVLLAIVAL